MSSASFSTAYRNAADTAIIASNNAQKAEHQG